ncbi:MAG: hypothetical protein P4M08_15140 [Oligoflexia bacterium]|nr:hypothetical protein [Oligoflexia bacterium]
MAVGILTAYSVYSADKEPIAEAKAERSQAVEKAPQKPDEQADDLFDEKADEKADAKTGKKQGFISSLLGTYFDSFQSIQSKVDELRRADEENQRLRLENANLRLAVEARNFSCNAEQSEKMTREYELKLGAETKSNTGRTLASITYKMPKELLPKELYALGVSYFRSRDDEKAAVILTYLMGLDDDETYKTPANSMMTGVAWYRLEHYAKAELYFDHVLKTAKGNPELAPLSREALIWKGLVAERIGKHQQAQAWLRGVLDAAPNSVEAAMVNRRIASTTAKSGSKDEADGSKSK